jgi:hypothetical protein
MRFRFILSHEIEGSIEISEPDGWRDAVLKLDRHETFHSLIEYFEGSFIFYGNNGVVNGGIDFIKSIIRTYGIDTTIEITIDITFDEETFDNVFTGQLGIADKEEVENNKMRVPIIRDDQWAKFMSRLDTPVNIQSLLNLDDGETSEGENVKLHLTSQTIRATFTGRFDAGAFIDDLNDDDYADNYIIIDVPFVDLDEIEEKFTLPLLPNTELPAWIIEALYAGEYVFDIRIEASENNNLTPTDNLIGVMGLFIQVNNETPIAFTEVNYGGGGTNESTVYTYNDTISINAGDIIRIYGLVTTPITGANRIYIWGETNDVIAIHHALEPPSQVENPSYMNIVANTSFPATDAECFLLHDVAGYIFDRITETQGSIYSELLGSLFTRYRQYPQNGCAWIYALIKGLQLRGYTLDEKSFFMSFSQWWKGIDPILNLSLGYETVQIPHIIDVSPDINLIEDLADWENAPGATWDFATFSRPFVSVNGAGGTEGYAAGEASFNEDQIYPFNVQVEVKNTGSETPNVIITWAILDAAFNEIVTQSYNYVGAGIKTEYFLLQPDEEGFYFGVKIENNTPTETKNFEVLEAFTEEAQIEYTQEDVVRIEEKRAQYDDTDGTSIDFSFVKNITSKYDNDRIWNKVSIGYTKCESEDVSGIDDPQSKRTFATRFKKVGKGIDLYSEFIAASLAIEKTRRTTREKSSDYKYDNETFIIALNPVEQDDSPQESPDVLRFLPETDENFSSVDGLLSSDTRYNLRITPTRNFLRWQDYLQGPLQSYLGSNFKFTSGDGNYSMSSAMDEGGCMGDDFGGNDLSENGDIPVDTDFVHLPDLYELTFPMEWEEYKTVRANRKKPIGVSLTDSGHKPMFIKSLDYKPVKGEVTILAWAKEYLDLEVISDTTPMRECYPSAAECEDALTDELGQILTNELGVCITE